MSLERLQKIRERRLNRQIKVAQELKEIMQIDEQHLTESKEALEQFHHWRLSQQEGMFKGLQGQTFSPQGIHEYQGQIEKLSQEEETLKHKIVEAGQKLEVSQKNYAEAKLLVNQLALKNEKTKEIVDIQDQAKLLQASTEHSD